MPSLPVTKLSCLLQLRLLDVSLSLPLSLPLSLDEPVVIDAKEDKELAPSDMFTRLSLYSPDAGSVLKQNKQPQPMQKLGLPMPVACALLCYASACMQHHSCRLDHMCKEFSCGPL